MPGSAMAQVCVCVCVWMAAWMDLLQPKNCHMGQDNFKTCYYYLCLRLKKTTKGLKQNSIYTSRLYTLTLTHPHMTADTSWLPDQGSLQTSSFPLFRSKCTCSETTLSEFDQLELQVLTSLPCHFSCNKKQQIAQIFPSSQDLTWIEGLLEKAHNKCSSELLLSRSILKTVKRATGKALPPCSCKTNSFW